MKLRYIPFFCPQPAEFTPNPVIWGVELGWGEAYFSPFSRASHSFSRDKVDRVWGRDTSFYSNGADRFWRRSRPQLLWGEENILQDLGNREEKEWLRWWRPLQMGRLYMVVAEHMCCRVRKTWVRVKQAVWPWPGHLTSLTLSLLFCKIRIRIDLS